MTVETSAAFRDQLLDALKERGVSFMFVSLERDEVTIGMAQADAIKEHGLFAPSAGYFSTCVNTRFHADDIACALKAMQDVLDQVSLRG